MLDHEHQQMAANAIAHAAEVAGNQVHACAIDVAHAYMKPSVLFHPALSRDGTQWCALYGANIMEGVAGFGDTPADAMAEFDKAWHAKTGVAPTNGDKP